MLACVSPFLLMLMYAFDLGLHLVNRYDFDFSKLTNLKSITLHAAFTDDIQLDVFLHIFSTLKAEELRQITMVFRHDNRYTGLERLDDCLAENFKDLEAVIIECVGLYDTELDEARQELRAMFPQMVCQNVLRIQSCVNVFRY